MISWIPNWKGKKLKMFVSKSNLAERFKWNFCNTASLLWRPGKVSFFFGDWPMTCLFFIIARILLNRINAFVPIFSLRTFRRRNAECFFFFMQFFSRLYFVENHQWKHQNNVGNLFKVNNKDTRTASLMSFWCLYC